jgi:hypothetical protein
MYSELEQNNYKLFQGTILDLPDKTEEAHGDLCQSSDLNEVPPKHTIGTLLFELM